MKQMNAESAIELKLWKQDLYQRIKDGDSQESLKKRNKLYKQQMFEYVLETFVCFRPQGGLL